MLVILAKIVRLILIGPAAIAFYVFYGLGIVIEWVEIPIDKKRNEKKLREWKLRLSEMNQGR